MDLGRFAFDRDLTFAALFLNSDGTTYGRFGSRSGRDGMRHVSLAGFESVVRRVLELHEAFPAGRGELAAKSTAPPSWGSQADLPVEPRGSHGNCVHCHNVGEAEVLALRELGEPILDRHLWPWVMPDLLGLSLDRDTQTFVDKVSRGSVAEKAGFRVGDDVRSASGQPILSIADVQWVLHNAAQRVELEVARGAERLRLTLPLEDGWRRASDVSWRVSWDLTGTAVGFLCKPLNLARRKSYGLPKHVLALQLTHTQTENQYLRFGNPGARDLFRKGDIIVAVDGRDEEMTPRELLAYVLQDKRPTETVALTLLRDGERLEVQLTLP